MRYELSPFIARSAMARRARILLATALLPICGAAAQAAPEQASPAPPAVLPSEESDTAVLGPAGPHRIFTLANFGAGAGAVVEGDDERLRVVAAIPMAGNAAMAVARDGSKIYVSETYWSHGNRGDRADLLSIYDGLTLNLEKEIPLPGRLHIVSKVGQMGLSSDGALAYVYALIPGSEAHVVDLAAGKLLTSVELSGCALVYPYGPRSFGTICGDGTVGTATVPTSPNEAAKVNFSPKFFDPDADPIFEDSIVDPKTGEGWFLSFSGKIYPAQLSGAAPVIGKPWSITEAAGLPVSGTGVQELAWRPGGGQLMAMHRASKRLFVLMHTGNYWTQKYAGTEVWVLDAASRTVVRRIPLASPAKSIVVTQDQKPLLFTYGAEGAEPAEFNAYDPQTGKKLRGRRLNTTTAFATGL